MNELQSRITKAEIRLRTRMWLLDVRRQARRMRDDTRGTSMVTTAITLPMFIVFLFGIWNMYRILVIKGAMHNGMLDATHYIAENGRYWAVGEESNVGGDLLPQDHYENQARRMIESRLRDVLFYGPEVISQTLTVKVTEPILAYHPDRTEDPVELGYWKDLCNSQANRQDEFRHHENIRFLVHAEFKVPFWQVRIPYMEWFDVTLYDRGTGYVECPRWRGKREADDFDKSKWLGAEGPFMKFRMLSTPAPIPTVTEAIPTDVPTDTPEPPTVTPVP